MGAINVDKNVCPVCNYTLTNGEACMFCGYHNSCDFEQCPTLCPIPAHSPSRAKLRTQWLQKQAKIKAEEEEKMLSDQLMHELAQERDKRVALEAELERLSNQMAALHTASEEYMHGFELLQGKVAKLEALVEKQQKEQSQVLSSASFGAQTAFQLGETAFANGNYAEAVKWYQIAAEQGSSDAQFSLGYCYAQGIGVTQSESEAMAWYCKAAEQGNEKAKANIRNSTKSGSKGTGVSKPSATKFSHLANRTFQFAEAAFGDENYVDAANWYKIAAGQGNAAAQFQLGNCYYSGIGVEENKAAAVVWYRKAADQGHAEAQLNLGLCYAQGTGVPKNSEEAAIWYRKAAKQRNAAAQLNLGDCYEQGRGVPKDELEAVKWYRRAADQGDAHAQYNMGCCYLLGTGVPENMAEAVQWYHKAAAQGHVDAQRTLGVCYERGSGTSQNLEAAIGCYRKAAAQGDVFAQKALERLNR